MIYKLNKIIKLCLPYGFVILIRKLIKRFHFQKELKWKARYLKFNGIFKNKYKGKRCFILGCGPSIKKQNLIFLKNEICFSVNSFFLHRDYQAIKPKFHVFSGLVNHDDISKEKGLEYYREMEKNLSDQVVFLNYKDRNIIRNNNFFINNKNIKYIDYSKSLEKSFVNLENFLKEDIDLTKPLFYIYNIVGIAIQLAYYMGFKEIYLLGVDHDWVFSFNGDRPINYFYDKKTDLLHNTTKELYKNFFWENIFEYSCLIFRQYRMINRFLIKKGVKVYNATDGGILDVFPRVKFNSLFNDFIRENKNKTKEKRL